MFPLAVRHVTPASFQASLRTIEHWTKKSFDNKSHHRGIDGSTGGVDEAREMPAEEPPANGVGEMNRTGGSSMLLDRLKRLSMQIQKPADSDAASGGVRERFGLVMGRTSQAVETAIHDGKAPGVVSGHETPILSEISLWASVSEVVPCLCSSSKQRVAISGDKKVVLAFKSGVYWSESSSPSKDDDSGPAIAITSDEAPSISRSTTQTSMAAEEESATASAERGGDGFVIPLAAQDKDTPFYFGIDCRADSDEIKLGKFPKAYSINPEDLKDSYLTSTILRTLEPLANQVHFCIIGIFKIFVRTIYSLHIIFIYSFII